MGNLGEKAQAAKDKTRETAQAATDKTQQAAQAAKEKTQENAGAAKEKASRMGQSTKESAQSGNDNTGGFLQQTGGKVKGMAQGATDAVKQTLGLGQNDQGPTHNRWDYQLLVHCNSNFNKMSFSFAVSHGACHLNKLYFTLASKKVGVYADQKPRMTVSKFPLTGLCFFVGAITLICDSRMMDSKYLGVSHKIIWK